MTARRLPYLNQRVAVCSMAVKKALKKGHAAVSGPGPFARGNVVLTHAGQCSRKKGFVGGSYFS